MLAIESNLFTAFFMIKNKNKIFLKKTEMKTKKKAWTIFSFGRNVQLQANGDRFHMLRETPRLIGFACEKDEG